MSFFGNRRQGDPPSLQPVVEKAQLPKPALPQAPVGFETVLGANSTLEGVLRSNANVRLDGAFTGTLEITGNVLVGETAKINADINAKNISIAGAVRGNVSGKKVQLLRTGRIWGDIRATALTTEEGAFIDGKITMVGHDTPPPVDTESDASLETEPVYLSVAAVDLAQTDETLPETSEGDTPEPSLVDAVEETDSDENESASPDKNQPS